MDIKLLIIFIILNIINVIMQTIKSIVTIKCRKGTAALVNALAYGLYTVVIVYTVCDLPLVLKAVIVGLVNLVGVWIVKWIEEICRKDKLWLVKITIPEYKFRIAKDKLSNIPHSYINLGKHYVFDCYCQTQTQTAQVLEVCKHCKGKAFATENKLF